MEYQILIARTPEQLETGVNEELQQGWIPLGGICVHGDETYGHSYYQAMTRERWTANKKYKAMADAEGEIEGGLTAGG